MSRPSLLGLAGLFGRLSLVSIGGANAVLPEIHRQTVDVLHWMNDAAFSQLFALAQTAPGPNVLLASVIGWKVAGLAGMAVATLAMLLPSSMLALAAGRGLRRVGDHPLAQGLAATLTPVALGLIVASGIIAARGNGAGPIGYAIVAGATTFVLISRRNPMIAMAAGAIVYALAGAAGLAAA